MSETLVQPKPRILLVIWIILTQLLALASLPLWLFGAVFALLPSGDMNFQYAIFLIFLFSYPLVLLGFAVAAWVMFAMKKNSLAGLFSVLTVLPMAVFYLILKFA